MSIDVSAPEDEPFALGVTPIHDTLGPLLARRVSILTLSTCIVSTVIANTWSC